MWLVNFNAISPFNKKKKKTVIVATKNVQRMCKVLNAFREDDKFCLKQCDMIIVVDMKISVIEDLGSVWIQLIFAEN